MALVSIITIVRNDLDGLKKTHRSVARQLCKDHDWVIVDGASTDGTAPYALNLQDTQTSVVSEPDQGIFDAMNKGLARARGEFVVFLNAGDTFKDEHTLQTVAVALKRGPVDFLYGDSLQQYAGDQLIHKVARGHLKLGYGMFACHPSMYYRRAVIGDLRFNPAFKIAGDYEFTSRFLRKTSAVVRLGAALSIFDLTGTSVQNKAKGRTENWRVQRDVLGVPWARRVLTRLTYLLTSVLSDHLPGVYRWLRFRVAA
ncbi:glycosyltransferase family 2 protein [Aquabacterium sp.]|uniref:glycosyltransferase family 2 protein n=1 Tax=Aquabacterium sp. TaxID=1872578 RepID=UPI003D6D64E5